MNRAEKTAKKRLICRITVFILGWVSFTTTLPIRKRKTFWIATRGKTDDSHVFKSSLRCRTVLQRVSAATEHLPARLKIFQSQLYTADTTCVADLATTYARVARKNWKEQARLHEWVRRCDVRQGRSRVSRERISRHYCCIIVIGRKLELVCR